MHFIINTFVFLAVSVVYQNTLMGLIIVYRLPMDYDLIKCFHREILREVFYNSNTFLVFVIFSLMSDEKINLESRITPRCL